MRELRNFEIEERAPVARPAPAHASPAQASLQDAEGQDLEILVVRARFFAGKAAAALLLSERTLPGRAVAHSIFRHTNDEDGTPSPPNVRYQLRRGAPSAACRDWVALLLDSQEEKSEIHCRWALVSGTSRLRDCRILSIAASGFWPAAISVAAAIIADRPILWRQWRATVFPACKASTI